MKRLVIGILVCVTIVSIGCKEDKNVSVSGIDIIKKTITLDVGKTEVLEVIISPSDATNKTVIWASSHPAIANVSSKGEVEAISTGEAVIIATTEDGGKIATCIATVNPAFDASLLLGKWKYGTLFKKYFSDDTGYVWDESDGVIERGASKFTWTLVGDKLVHNMIMEMGVVIPRNYTVSELTEITLKYKDDFGKSYSFLKLD